MITSISISQNNVYEGSNLLPVHSPLAFIVDVHYTDTVPDVLNCEIYDGVDLLETYRIIPWADPLPDLRQFLFLADEPIRTLLDSFDDDLIPFDTFSPVENITKELILKFVDPDDELIFYSFTGIFAHGAQQFGHEPNLKEQFNNDSENYFCAKDSFCYIYFFNDDASNEISVIETLVPDFARDYNDDLFTDYNDDYFIID